MMVPWAPQPLALLFDPRVKKLLWPERGVLHHLHLVAAATSPDGVTVAIARRPGEAAAAAWAGAFGVDGATAIGKIIEAGLAVECPEGLRLTLAPGGRGGPPGGAPGAAARAAGDPSERPEGAAPPSPEVVAARARKLKWAFDKRVGELAGVPADVTWEAWRESPEGRETYARRVLGYGKTERARDASGTFRPATGTRSGNATGTPPERHGNGHGNAPLTSSETSGIEDKKREERSDTAGTERNAERNAERHGNGTPLDALRGAVGGRATLAGALTIEQEFAGVVARARFTEAELPRAALAFEDPAAWWPKGKHPAPKHVTLNDLAGFRGEGGFEWRAFAALVAHVRAPKPAPRPPPRRTPSPATAPAERPARLATAADTRRLHPTRREETP